MVETINEILIVDLARIVMNATMRLLEGNDQFFFEIDGHYIFLMDEYARSN
jgi:hypothetical protein